MTKLMGALTGALFVLATHATAQVAVEVTPVVRDSLARAWDDSTPTQVERGYCLTWAEDTVFGVRVLHINGFVRPDSVHAQTPYSIAFYCPKKSAPLHTHTPTTCQTSMMQGVVMGTCKLGGTDAYECFPSWPDVLHLTALGDPVGFIQCDKHAIVPYGPLRRAAPPPPHTDVNSLL